MLNAFRHYRIERLATGIAASRLLSVLNAFRHYRIERFTEAATDDGNILCSTPFGIIESNAELREHLEAMATECSTPFGIIESNARRAVARQ